MSLPKTKITIGRDGKVVIEGMEKSDSCHELIDMAKKSGKILSQEKKEHVPVYHDVHQRNN